MTILCGYTAIWTLEMMCDWQLINTKYFMIRFQPVMVIIQLVVIWFHLFHISITRHHTVNEYRHHIWIASSNISTIIIGPLLVPKHAGHVRAPSNLNVNSSKLLKRLESNHPGCSTEGYDDGIHMAGDQFILFITPFLIKELSIEMSVLCLTVCLLAYLRNHTSKFHQIYRACYLQPWLGSVGIAMGYVLLVLHMTSCFHIMDAIAGYRYCRSITSALCMRKGIIQWSLLSLPPFVPSLHSLFDVMAHYHLFHHSCLQVHCINHLFTIKPRPPGAMQIDHFLTICDYVFFILLYLS